MISGSTLGCAQPVSPDGASGSVNAALDSSQEHLEQLLFQLDNLGGRLNDVLRPIPPSDQACSGRASSPVPLADRVEAMNGRILSALSFVRSINERLDI